MNEKNKTVEMRSRRDLMRLSSASCLLSILAISEVGCAAGEDKPLSNADTPKDTTSTDDDPSEKETTMKIHYLEIVTPDVESTCQTYEKIHGVEFAGPEAMLGNARTAKLPGGAMLGVRAPLRSDEIPVVRPYFLVDDIKGSIAQASEAGAEIAIPAMEIPGFGTCAIFILGGIEHALWQI